MTKRESERVRENERKRGTGEGKAWDEQVAFILSSPWSGGSGEGGV